MIKLRESIYCCA